MPNWTHIKLTVKNTGNGYEDLLEIFTPDDAGENNLFEKIIPSPTQWLGDQTDEELEKFLKKDAYARATQQLLWDAQNLAKYGSKDIHDWCCTHWGTKWDACYYVMHRADEHSFYVTFSTANGFPKPILEKIKQMFPEVYFFGSGDDDCYNYGVDFVYRPENLDGLICNFTEPKKG